MTEPATSASDHRRRSAKAGAIAGAFQEGMEPKVAELRAYLPSEELVGGSVPHVPGLEDEAVWNAAAQSCGTERIHYCYTINEDRCWYLAAPSSALASHPDSWCPLASALPGNSEFWDKQTVYIYEQEGAASALKWDQETGRMQVFLGASRTLLPRIQSMDANFVSINQETATPVPWRNMSLRREKLARLLIRGLFFCAVLVTISSLLVWIGAYVAANTFRPNLEKAREASANATNQLMVEAANALQTNTDQILARIIELLNTTSSFGGTLTRYEVKTDGGIEWEALIPSAVQPGQLKAVALGTEDGRVRVKGSN